MFQTTLMTQKAKEAVTYASFTAMLRGDTQVATEHLLISLMEGSQNTVAQILLRIQGLSQECVEAAIAHRDRMDEDVRVSPETASLVQATYTDSFVQAIELASQEALFAPNLRQDGVVGTEHLLIGLAIEPNGFAGFILSESGAHFTKLRTVLAKLREE